MKLPFFGKGPGGLDEVESHAADMLRDARHSFDLACRALLTDTPAAEVAEDVRHTDHRINQAEQDLRRALVVHVSVQGTADIGRVLGLMLLLKKVERIGDQAKNILDLAESGVSFAGSPDIDAMVAEQEEVSDLFGEAADLITDTKRERADHVVERGSELTTRHQARIDGYMFSEQPGREVVPLAIYYRYLKRIVANLRGIVGVALEPLPHIDYLDDGATDTDD